MSHIPTLAGSFKPDIAPVLDSLALSALIAALPLITMFVTLGWLRWKAHWAGLAAAGVAILVAVLAFGMPRPPRAPRSASSRSCGSSSRRSCSIK